MSATEPDVVARLTWGLRHYIAVLMVPVLAAGAFFLVRPPGGSGDTYEAAALVAASTLEINPLQLPRTVDAVFKSGSVAESVATEVPDVGPAHRLVPDAIRVEPLNDTIVVRVIGRASQPTRAAELANAAAFSLVAELNRLGSGVGEFVLQDRARPPARPIGASSAVTLVALGILSGGILGLGLVALLLLVRQPVVRGDEAATLVGAPLLVSLQLPAGRRDAQLESISGLSLLTKQMFPTGTGLCALVDTGAYRARLQLMPLIARLIGRTEKVLLVVPPREQDPLRKRIDWTPNARVLSEWLPAPSGGLPLRSEETAVLFGLSARAFDVPQLLPPGTRVVILVAEGVSRRRMGSAAGQFGTGDVHGLVFVTRSRRLARKYRTGRGVGVVTPDAGTPEGRNGREKVARQPVEG